MSGPQASGDVGAYYERFDESERLSEDEIELLRSRELLGRWLPEPPAEVLDVGGGPGVYALWLTERGYEVDLIDLVPKHLHQARAAADAAGLSLRSAEVGDARSLDRSDASVDVVLLMGPLYHLPERDDRAAALREAYRVLRPGGSVVAAAIGRWASTMDGLRFGMLGDPGFAEIVERDARDGVHLNTTNTPGWFTTAFFHTPAELAEEVVEAGFETDGAVAVEGPWQPHPSLLDGGAKQAATLEALRRFERDPSVIGASGHLLIHGIKAARGPAQS